MCATGDCCLFYSVDLVSEIQILDNKSDYFISRHLSAFPSRSVCLGNCDSTRNCDKHFVRLKQINFKRHRSIDPLALIQSPHVSYPVRCLQDPVNWMELVHEKGNVSTPFMEGSVCHVHFGQTHEHEISWKQHD